jgi:hypothetical protein
MVDLGCWTVGRGAAHRVVVEAPPAGIEAVVNGMGGGVEPAAIATYTV